MIAALKRFYGNFRGFDLSHSAVPPMEGPLKPNTALDAAPVVLTLPGVDNLVATADGLLCTSGAELLTLSLRPAGEGAPPGFAIDARRSFAAGIACLAGHAEGGLAIGLDSGGMVIAGGRHDGKTIGQHGDTRLGCPTAALFLDGDTLLVANGSAETAASDWKRDLMNRGASGSLWIVDLAASGKAERVADRLAFPSGIAVGADGGFLVSEAWRHRVLGIDRSGRTQVMLADLPAYPGRLAPASGSGFWLALFAPRNSLVEFVLLEKGYRDRMVAQIEPDFWIAPALSSGKSFLEPIQGGARKKLNMLKPWSPSWSYGLVARCDAAMRPLASAHSRADGAVHGVTSVCERDGVLYAGAKGAGVIVALDTDEMMGGFA